MDFPRLELSAAFDSNWGIGKNNKLPWSIPSEYAYFLRMTQNPKAGKKHACIFGRLTWESIPPAQRPWKNSISFVVSRSMKSNIDTLEHCHDKGQEIYIAASLDEVVHHLRHPSVREKIDRIWVQGGTEIYRQAFASPQFHRLYLTMIDRSYPADVFFPAIDTNRLQLVDDPDVPQGVQEDGGVTYRVYVYQTTGVNPLTEAQ